MSKSIDTQIKKLERIGRELLDEGERKEFEQLLYGDSLARARMFLCIKAQKMLATLEISTQQIQKLEAILQDVSTRRP